MIGLQVTGTGDDTLRRHDGAKDGTTALGEGRNSVELKDYVRLLRRRWWILVLCTVLGGVGAYVATQRQPEVYGSGLTFFLADAAGRPVSGEATQSADARIASYATLVASAPVRQLIAEATGTGDFGANAFASGPIFMRLNTTSNTPEAALEVAQAYAEEFPDYIARFESGGARTSGATLGILEPPTLNTVLLSPNVRRNVLVGVVLGLVVGAGLVLLSELLDNRVRDVDELEDMTNVGVAAAVPWEFPGQHLVAERRPRSQRAEALRLVRTNVQFAGMGAQLRTLVVTSPGAGEGKTSIATDLALAYAQAGQRVVLLDADLRRPRIAELFGVAGGQGATNVLVGDVPLAEAVRPWGDGHLRLLSSGTRPARPSELLASAKMGQLLAELAEDNDLVIIDSAPILPVADTVALLAHVDAVLLVVRAGTTTGPQVRAAVERLKSVDARIVGLVLNGARSARPGPYYSDGTAQKHLRSRRNKELLDVPSDVVAPPSSSSPPARDQRLSELPRAGFLRSTREGGQRKQN